MLCLMLIQLWRMSNQQFQSDQNCKFSSPPPNHCELQIRKFSLGKCSCVLQKPISVIINEKSLKKQIEVKLSTLWLDFAVGRFKNFLVFESFLVFCKSQNVIISVNIIIEKPEEKKIKLRSNEVVPVWVDFAMQLFRISLKQHLSKTIKVESSINNSCNFSCQFAMT